MTHPSATMKRLAARWHQSQIRLETVVVSPDVDPVTLQPVETITYLWEGTALLQQAAVARSSGQAQDYGVDDLIVGVDSTAVPERRQRVTIISASDSTLAGKVGHVETVDRHDIAARRRMIVRLDSTT